MNPEGAHTGRDTLLADRQGVTQQRGGEAPIVRILVDLRRPLPGSALL